VPVTPAPAIFLSARREGAELLSTLLLGLVLAASMNAAPLLQSVVAALAEVRLEAVLIGNAGTEEALAVFFRSRRQEANPRARPKPPDVGSYTSGMNSRFP